MNMENTQNIESQTVNIENLPKGELIHKATKQGKGKRLFELVGYCRTNRAYQIDAYDDISVCYYLKKGTQVYLENGSCDDPEDGVENFGVEPQLDHEEEVKLTKPRTLKDLENDPRVSSIHKEDDEGEKSWWCVLNAGWQDCQNRQCHTLHETKLKDILWLVGNAEPWTDDPELDLNNDEPTGSCQNETYRKDIFDGSTYCDDTCAGIEETQVEEAAPEVLDHIVATKDRPVYRAECDWFGFIDESPWKECQIESPVGDITCFKTFAINFTDGIKDLHAWIIENQEWLLKEYPKAKFNLYRYDGTWNVKKDYATEEKVYSISLSKAKKVLFIKDRVEVNTKELFVSTLQMNLDHNARIIENIIRERNSMRQFSIQKKIALEKFKSYKSTLNLYNSLCK